MSGNRAPTVLKARSRLEADSFLDRVKPEELVVQDADGDTGFVYTVQGLPSSGVLLLGGVPLGRGATFTQEHLESGRVQYIAGPSATLPRPNEPVTDTFKFTVSDGKTSSSEATFTFELAPYDTVQTVGRSGTYQGTAGRDYQQGGAGNDRMLGNAGHDTLVGNDGADSLSGGTGNDRLYGGTGRDTLYGDREDDLLEGGEGADLLYGGSGNDALGGGLGAADRLWGGSGDDTFFFRRGDGKDSVEDFSLREADVLDLRGFGFKSFDELRSKPGAVVTTSGGDTILKLTDADWLTVENVRAGQLQESDFMFV